MTTTVTVIGSPVPQTTPLVPNAGMTPLPFTKMPLFDWAERMGLNPIHFAGGTVSGRFAHDSTCSNPWPRYTWQNGAFLSHMDVALTIQNAEATIEEYLRFHVAPAYRTETWEYPRYHNLHRTNGYDMTGRRPSIQMSRGKILAVATRKQEYLGTAEIFYQDLDGDNYNETAYVSLPDIAGIDQREIAIFPAGLTDHPSWQLRHPKRWGVAGEDRYFLFDYWHMVNPEVLSRLPGEFHIPPDLDNIDSFLTHVDICRVYPDRTDSAAVSLEWENVGGCAIGDTLTTQGGVGIVRDPEVGLVAAGWSPNCQSFGSPDRQTISYYSGAVYAEYEQGYTLNPLGGLFADAVFYLATARLKREMCGCAEARVYAADLQKDMSLVSPQGNFLAVADEIQTCPFGTRRGEWLSYQALKLIDKHIEAAIF